MTAARALAEVSRALTSFRQPQEVLDLIVGHLCSLTGATKALLVEVGADERVRVIASHGLATPIRELVPAHDRDGLAMTAITERRTVWSSDVLNVAAVQLSPLGRAFIEREGLRATLGVPLLAHTSILGALVACRDQVGEFSAGEIEAAEALAALAALALERGRLNAVEVARLRQDQALVDVEREMLAELNTERLFPMILERAGLLVNARGTIYVLEPGRAELGCVKRALLRHQWAAELPGLPRAIRYRTRRSPRSCGRRSRARGYSAGPRSSWRSGPRSRPLSTPGRTTAWTSSWPPRPRRSSTS